MWWCDDEQRRKMKNFMCVYFFGGLVPPRAMVARLWIRGSGDPLTEDLSQHVLVHAVEVFNRARHHLDGCGVGGRGCLTGGVLGRYTSPKACGGK